MNQKLVMQIVLGSIMASTPAFVGIALLITREARPTTVAPMVIVVLSLVALSLLAQAPVLERLFARRGEAMSPTDGLSAAYQGKIVGFAMREGCAVIGLVVAVISADWRYSAAASAMALLAMILAWPKAKAGQPSRN